MISARASIAVLLGLAITLALAACGSQRQNSSSCGTPYLLRAGKTQAAGGSCAGQIVNLGVTRVKAKQTFTIRIIHEKNGKLTFPLPVSTGPAVEFTGLRDGVASYKARETGTVRLVARHTTACAENRHRDYRPPVKPRSCTAFKIKVTGSR